MKIYLTTFLSFFIISLFAQVERTNYSLSYNGKTLDLAWSGGFNAPQWSKIDLNFDGHDDLFSFERGWDATIKTFIWQDGEYVFAPEYASKFPLTRNWCLLEDYNCDGKMDIFTWSEFGGGISIYKNTSENNELTFERVETLLFTESSNGPVNVFVNGVDIPEIVDVDGDGDLDILAFSIAGIYVEMQENLSMDLYGVCDSLEFQLGDACWGKFAENGLTNALNLDTNCTSLSPAIQGARHGGSTILALDDDGDGDIDIALGDVSYSNLVFARNGGTTSSAFIDSSRGDFPMESKSVDLKIFPAGYHIDVDNDGFKDILISPNMTGFSIDKRNVWYYRNTSTSLDPEFEFIQDDFLVGEMLDVGFQSQPIIIDVDADGLKDILVFNDSEFFNDQMFSNITYLKNVGTTNEPSFDIVDTNYLDLRSLELTSCHGTFADMDNDGDVDMIMSDQPGKVYYFQNQAGPNSSLDLVLINADYYDLDFQGFGTPFLYDFNGDSIIDIVTGDKRGELSYYENQGTKEEALFVDSLKVSSFGGIDVSEFCCGGYSSPFALTKNDSLLLYVGSEESILYTYLIDSENLESSFELLDSVNYGTVRLKPCLDDLDNDGKLDMLLGENYGGVQAYELGGIETSVKSIEVENLALYPVPASELLNLGQEVRDYKVFNSMGQLVLYGGQTEGIVVSGLSDGVYYITAMVNDQVYTARFLKKDK